VSGRAMKHLPAVLIAVALGWIAGAKGVGLAPWSVLATLGAAVALAIRHRSGTIRWQASLAWLSALLCWATLLAAVRPVAAADAARAVGTGVMALLLAAVVQRPRAALWSRAAVAMAGSCTGVWLAVERLALGKRPLGPFDNANQAAVIALLAVAVAPWVGKRWFVRLGVAAVSLAGVVCSGSRAALLGALVLGAVWAVVEGRGALRWGVVVLSVLAGLGLAWRLASDRDPLRFERVRIWSTAIRAALAEMPLGCAPGGFEDAALPHNFAREGEYARYSRSVTLAESDFLQLAVTLGLPGLLLAAGLVASLVRQLGGNRAAGLGVGAVVLVTSAVHTQLCFPVVCWTAVLAVAGCCARPRGRPLRLNTAQTVTAAMLLASAAFVALVRPEELSLSPRVLVERAQKLAVGAQGSDPRLADGEAAAWQATALRPRFALGWRVLGGIRLDRAVLRGDVTLADAALQAFARARTADPHDAWSAFGEGQARQVVGDLEGSTQAYRSATALEPNFVEAWVELGLTQLERGEISAAKDSLERAERARRLSQRTRFVGNYERGLAEVDSARLRRLRSALGRQS